MTEPLARSLTQVSTQVLIVGGGAVGMALAIGLAKQRYQVCLIDAGGHHKTCDDARDSRVFALNLPSLELLKELGVYEHIARKADYVGMQVWQSDGTGELRFGQDALTPTVMGSMIEPKMLDGALCQVAHDDSIAQYLKIYDQTVIDEHWLDVRQNGVVVRAVHKPTQARHEIFTQLLVAADGRGSTTRRLLGIGIKTLDYQQTAICCAIKTEKPHNHIARQAMLPTGTLALLPLADVQMCDKGHWQSVVWTLPKSLAKAYLQLEHDKLAQKLAMASGCELGRITQIESVASFDLSAQVADEYIRPFAVLVGDAAHGVHPLAGQGLNLGFLDVKAVLKMTHHAKITGMPIYDEAGLRRYQREVRAKNAVMMHGFSCINYAFSGRISQREPLRFLRAYATSKVAKSPRLLRFFNRQAGGVS